MCGIFKVSLIFFTVLSLGCEKKTIPLSIYEELNLNYGELNSKRKLNFEKLIFKLDSDQKLFGKSPVLKLIDQFGEPWLFKPGDVSVNGALVVQSFYTYFGQNSASLFKKTLNINGKLIDGSVQRFLPVLESKPTLIENSFLKLSEENLFYLGICHLFGWILTNHQVHQRQFIMVENSNLPTLYRIDNSVEWKLIKTDSLDMQYVTPLLWLSLLPGYSEFWRTIIKHRKINYSKLLAFAKLITHMPEEHFLSFFTPVLSNNMNFSLNKKEEEFNSLLPEIESFSQEEYEELLKTRKIKVFDNYKQYLEQINSLATRFQNQNEINNYDIKTLKDEILSYYKSEIEKEDLIVKKFNSLTKNLNQ